MSLLQTILFFLFLIIGMELVELTKRDSVETSREKLVRQIQRKTSENNMSKILLDNERKEELKFFIEQNSIRVCRALSEKAKSDGCNYYLNPYAIWSFYLSNGAAGDLKDVLEGTTTDVFSCSALLDGSYGRYLLGKTMPHTTGGVDVWSRFKYDLSDIPNKNVGDPCAYADFIKE